MSAIGQRATVGLTLPIVALGVVSLRAAAAWDTAMTNVAKTVDEPEARIKQLGTEFVKLSEKIPVASNALAAIGAQAGQLGIQTENILGFTKVIAALGVSTNLSNEMAGSSLARLSNIMGTSQGDFDRMGSAIVDLGNNLATTEAEIVNFGLRIAGAGEIAKLRESDVLAIGAALSSVGIKAEAGGTAVQKALIAMNTAVATGSADIQIFARVAGLAAEEFAAKWKSDPIEAFTLFIEGLRREGDNAVPVLNQLFDKNARLIRSFLSLSNAGDLLRRAVVLSSDAWEENVALAEEASKFYNRLAADFERVANKAKNVAAELGDAIAPEAKKATTAVGVLLDISRGWIEIFTSLPGPIRTTAVALVALTAALGPAAIGAAAFVRAWGFIAGTRAAMTAVPGLLAAIATVVTPAGALVVGLGVAAAALLGLAVAHKKMAAEVRRPVVITADDLKLGIKEAEGQMRRFRSAAEAAGDTALGRNFQKQALAARNDYIRLSGTLQALEDDEKAAAAAAAALGNQLGDNAAVTIPRISIGLSDLSEIAEDLERKLTGARKELLVLQLSQQAAAEGTDEWTDLGDSIATTANEIERAEKALRAVNDQMSAIRTARLAGIDFSQPGALAPGVQQPIRLGPNSAALQLREALEAMKKSQRAAGFGLTVEQLENLDTAASQAGVSTEEYAQALGLVTQQTQVWQNVAITGIGSVVTAFASGFENMRVVVVRSFTQILQGLSQQGGPLGGIFGGFGVPVFGALGGILAAVLSRGNDTQPVLVDSYSSRAIDQQKQFQPPAPKVDIILVDSRGNEIARTAAGLARLETLDGVTRLPEYPRS